MHVDIAKYRGTIDSFALELFSLIALAMCVRLFARCHRCEGGKFTTYEQCKTMSTLMLCENGDAFKPPTEYKQMCTTCAAIIQAEQIDIQKKVSSWLHEVYASGLGCGKSLRQRHGIPEVDQVRRHIAPAVDKVALDGIADLKSGSE